MIPAPETLSVLSIPIRELTPTRSRRGGRGFVNEVWTVIPNLSTPRLTGRGVTYGFGIHFTDDNGPTGRVLV